jgi:hypothetical protein
MMAVQLKSVAQIRFMSRKSMIAGIQMNSAASGACGILSSLFVSISFLTYSQSDARAKAPGAIFTIRASSPRPPAPVVACEFPARRA